MIFFFADFQSKGTTIILIMQIELFYYHNFVSMIHSIQLNKYPEMMIRRVTVPKTMKIRRQVITFLSIVASGMERPMMAIMKAMAVPRGMPLATNTSMMGTMLAGLAYIGTASMTASGTPHQLSAARKRSKKPSGM